MESSGTPEPSGASASADPPPTTRTEENWSDKVKAIGGLVAVAVGVCVVGVIAVIALIKDSDTAATIASSAGGVIATVVGAYFGVKVGSDQSRTAIEAQREEAAKAQIYAAHLPPDQAEDVLRIANETVGNIRTR
jgi:uncharacterized protein YacL